MVFFVSHHVGGNYLLALINEVNQGVNLNVLISFAVSIQIAVQKLLHYLKQILN